MGGSKRKDGTEVFAEGESFKTGSSTKERRLEAFVDWLLTPEEERKPRTKREWAEHWGVGAQTVRNDQREPYVQRELAKRAREVARVDLLPAVIQNLYRMASGGTADLGGGDSGAATPAAAQVSAAKTLLDWMERTAPIREGHINYRELSGEQLTELALAFLDEAAKADDLTPSES